MLGDLRKLQYPSIKKAFSHKIEDNIMKLTKQRLMEMAGIKPTSLTEEMDDDNPDYFRDVRDESDLGDLLDEMMDDEEGADQGMAPSELIDHDFIEKQSKRIGLRLDMDKVAEMAELNDDEFVYSGAEIISSAKK